MNTVCWKIYTVCSGSKLNFLKQEDIITQVLENGIDATYEASILLWLGISRCLTLV
jgi:hypothetical protein